MIGALGPLSWLQNNLKKLMQKATNPAYNADTDSNEALREAIDGLNDLSEAQDNAQVDAALDTAVPASNTADSVNDILLDQLKPRLPAGGTLQTAAFRKGVSVELIFPIYDKDGDLVSSAVGLDSEISKDGGSFADCTNEATNIGNGVYKLTLTADEMNADRIAVITKTTTTDAKNTLTVIYTAA